MKIRVLSDLHLETAAFAFRHRGEDLVILAGDIADGTPMALHHLESLFAQIRTPTVYVCGNHEFHQRYEPLSDAVETIRRGLPAHVRLLHRESAEIGGLTILGCPLWTDFRLGDSVQRGGHSLGRERAMHAAALSIPDFGYLTDARGEAIGPAGMSALHDADRAWLGNRIKQAETARHPVIVVTHWLPSPESVAPQHVGSILTPYFASDCRDLLRPPVRLWIHGHTHVPRRYRHGDTEVVCNPRGTGPLGPQVEAGFDPDLMVTVPVTTPRRPRRSRPDPGLPTKRRG